MLRFLNGSDELIVPDRFQQEVHRTHLIALKGILLKGGRENHLRALRQHTGEFHTIEVGHLDIHEGEADRMVFQPCESLYGVSKGMLQLQLGCLLHK